MSFIACLMSSGLVEECIFFRISLKLLFCLGWYVWNSVSLATSSVITLTYVCGSLVCTLTCSLLRILISYSVLATSSNKLVRDGMLITPAINIGGDLGIFVLEC